MIIDIDRSGDVPIYEQLRRRIVAGIANDELAPGDRLPSVRALAVDLGVNLHTVNKAYALLRDDGYLVMRRGSGAVVADRRDVRPDAVAGNAVRRIDAEQDWRMNDELYRLALEHKARGGGMAAFLAAARRQCARVYGMKADDTGNDRRAA